MATAVTISVPRPAPMFTPMFLAVDKGFLEKEGLKASIEYMGSQAAAQRLVDGKLDFLGVGGFMAFLNGADIRLVCGHSNQGGAHVLAVRPEIQSVKELREVTVAADENVVELRHILAHHDIDLDKSGIKITYIDGSHPKQFEALKRGVGDGAMLGAPWWIYAVKEGYKNMGSGAEVGPGLHASGTCVTTREIAEHPEQVRGFVRAYVKSVKYSKENVAGTLETMMRYSSEWGVDNPEIAKAVYDLFAPHWKAEVDVQSVAVLLKSNCERMGKPPLPPDRFLELQFLEEALSEAG